MLHNNLNEIWKPTENYLYVRKECKNNAQAILRVNMSLYEVKPFRSLHRDILFHFCSSTGKEERISYITWIE